MTFPEWFFPKIVAGRKRLKFAELRPGLILLTIDRLKDRIEVRFPDSGLFRVCSEFRELSVETEILSRKLAEPIWPVRLFSIAAAVLLGGAFLGATSLVFQKFKADDANLVDLLQATESAINEVIFLGLALFFLTSLESRLKRQAALRALHRLRSIAHVVDMHQLTKDPTTLLATASPSERLTPASPERTFSTFELSRYLDYCSEMLALMAKTAALFAQTMDDPVVLTAVNDMESLTQGLSGKIWQKIMILDLAIEQKC